MGIFIIWVLIIIWLVLTWFLHVKWNSFKLKYVPSILHLLLSSFLLLMLVLSFHPSMSQIWSISKVIIAILAALYGLMAVTRLAAYQMTRTFRSRSLFRASIYFDRDRQQDFSITQPDRSESHNKNRIYQEITLETEDSVKIRVTQISSGMKKAIIIAHGAFRHRHVAIYVILAQWLAYSYDVFSFDFRGHGESGGFFDFSDSTRKDLRAVIQYVKSMNYEKVGIFGRSMGAWTTLLEIAEENSVDSIISAASPLNQIADISLAKKFGRLMRNPLFRIFLSHLTQIFINLYRNTRVSGVISSGKGPIEVAVKIKIPVFLIYHEYDPVIEVRSVDAYRLYDVLSTKKAILILSGQGHIFELVQFQKVYQSIEDWFQRTL